MDETLRRAAPLSFVIALLCFLLPFVHVSCSGRTVADVRGVELALGASRPPPESSGATEAIEVRPHLSAMLAIVSAVVALAATATRRKRAEGIAALFALLGAAFLLLLRTQVRTTVEETGQGSLTVSFGVAYWLSLLSLLAGAGALFARAGIASHPEGPPPEERDPTTIPPEPRGT